MCPLCLNRVCIFLETFRLSLDLCVHVCVLRPQVNLSICTDCDAGIVSLAVVCVHMCLCVCVLSLLSAACLTSPEVLPQERLPPVIFTQGNSKKKKTNLMRFTVSLWSGLKMPHNQVVSFMHNICDLLSHNLIDTAWVIASIIEATDETKVKLCLTSCFLESLLSDHSLVKLNDKVWIP